MGGGVGGGVGCTKVFKAIREYHMATEIALTDCSENFQTKARLYNAKGNKTV